MRRVETFSSRPMVLSFTWFFIHSSLDLQVNFSLNYHGQQLIQDTDLSLSMGNRYGLIGLNGSGKSAMLTALGRRLVAIPEHISMYHVDQEAQPSEVTALDTVLADLEQEVQKLEAEYEELCETDPDSDRCQEICDRWATRVLPFLLSLSDGQCQDWTCSILSWRLRALERFSLVLDSRPTCRTQSARSFQVMRELLDGERSKSNA